MKYQVGDKVKVRSWSDMLKDGTETSEGIEFPKILFSTFMKRYCGKNVVITRVNESEEFYDVKADCDLAENAFSWTDYMFEEEELSLVISQIKKEVYGY